MSKIGLGSVVLSVEDHGLWNVDRVSFIASALCTEGLIFLGGKLSHTDYQLKQHEENHTCGSYGLHYTHLRLSTGKFKPHAEIPATP